MQPATTTTALIIVIAAFVVMLNAWQPWASAEQTHAGSNEGLSLITSTPEEGFDVALTLARRGVTETQPDTDVLHELRDGYANDSESLIAASHVVAVHFRTVAEANNYWRE